ncbi:phenylacetate--CoA ligase family protein [Desulfothermobacter acidiphilus]|uniref:phenylacetate--CoA ligase family protein n=1 Tax=Desulfothermobacter acidiphilus TaxID=1938353 RepID=UPI003F8B5591
MWNQPVECLPREELRRLQFRRLQEVLQYAYAKVPFYRQRFQSAGVRPEDIRQLEDIKYLPFTTKDDLRDNYPFGLFAVPMQAIVRIHASSGTTGKPTVVGYTRHDIEVWSEVMARTLGAAGASPRDVVQIAYGYGLFTGGLGVHYGAEKIGCTVIPTSGGNTKRQIMLMRDFGTTILCCTPSYACYLAEVMAELGVKREELKLRAGLFGAEPWSEGMRREIESSLGIEALDIYGLSEIIGPGVAAECPAKGGLHIWEDHFLPEVIDPATGEPVPPGEEGELVFTTLTKEALPVIRYRTRDISLLLSDPCPCGRTHVRMAKVKGRTDDMLIIRGVNVFPSQIEEVLLSLGYTEPHYVLVVDREKRLDVLEVWVEVSEHIFRDEVRGMEELEEKIRREIEALLGIGVKVRLVEPKSIQRSEGKAKRIIDRRDMK